jgi:hypothetical protein
VTKIPELERMAVFPAGTRETARCAQDKFLSQWPVFAAALLIAFVALVSGGLRDSQAILRIAHSSEKSSETPQASKRDPIRTLATAERKEAGPSQWSGSSGALAFNASALTIPDFAQAIASPLGDTNPFGTHWPVPLPRAPPSAS